MSFADACHVEDQRIAEGLRDAEGQLIARGIAIVANNVTRIVNLTASPLPSDPGWRIVTLSDAGQQGESGAELAESEIGAPAILAHEIKNPLSAIRGASQLLARRSEPQNRPLADLISAEVDRIARLIDRMQQLGSRSVDPLGPINLHEAIRTAMATVRAARPEGPELVEEFDPSLPPVLASRDALEQVVINLLANACDAADGIKGAQVIVRTRYVSGLIFKAVRLGRALRLPIEVTISDPGAGVPEDIRNHVFRPFVTSKPKGQGLGLALVRKLITDMGGSIAHERDAAAARTLFRINLSVANEDHK